MKTENVTLSTGDKLALVSNLSTMLAAGIPILEAVDSLKEDSKGGQKKILETLGADLISGKRINFSLAKFSRVFDRVTVNIIKASEDAGTLDVTLKDLKTNIKRDIEFSDRIKSAMIYPILILIVFVGVSIMILTFVIPKIATVFSRMDVVLPLPTKIMIWLSNAILTYTIPLSIAVIAIAVGFYFLFQRRKKEILDLLSHLPLISDLTRKIDLTRFTRSFYLLLSSGIPITTALELTEDVVIKKDVAKAIVHLKENVLAGKKMSGGLKDNKKIFPTIMIKIAEAGEKTGSLDKSMQDASEYLDYEVTNTLKTLTTLLEPILLVVVGILIGGMMMAIISPIYGMIGQLGAGGA